MPVAEVAQRKPKPLKRHVSVHLLAVTCLSLKIERQSLTIEEAFPCDDASSNTLSKNIQESGLGDAEVKIRNTNTLKSRYLSSTRFSHQSGQFSRSDESQNIVQQ
jgi:hypothetical protein